MKHKLQKPWVGFVIIVVLAAGLAWYVMRPHPETGTEDTVIVTHNTPEPTKPGEDPTPRLKNSLTVSTQKAGSSIIVDEVSLQKAGFIVIHENDNGKPGKVVAQSNLVSVGTKQDLIVRLTTKAGSSYFAMLHADDGNKRFDATLDLPINTAKAEPVMVKFDVVK